jgi:hypothetical protein
VGIHRAYPKPVAFRDVLPEPFMTDLTYTFLMLGVALLASGLLWLIVWDQRYRCRTCLRRLRSPKLIGAWNHLLMGAPQTEYICFYGHGTLKVDEIQITGHHEPDWRPHTDDIWKELYELEAKK